MTDSQTTSPRLAFVFPGQGSQSTGMLSALAVEHRAITETFAEASEGAGVDLWALSQGDAEELNRTEYTQPALLAAGVAVWHAWQDQGGLQPALLAGHSLGEYSALVAAGAISLVDAARLVRLRGQLMQQAAPAGSGAMAAVIGADDALVAEVCQAVSGDDGVVVPANYNSPGQVVIGGHARAVDAAIAELAERGAGKAVRLAVSVPSHTPLMRGAADLLAEAMSGVSWRSPALEVVHNVDAESHSDPLAIRDALVRQLYLPVQWTRCVQSLAQRGATRIGECGPGKVLAGLVRRIDKSIEARPLGGVAEFDAALADWRL